MKEFHIYFDGYANVHAETEEEAIQYFERLAFTGYEMNIEEIVEGDEIKE